MKHVIVRFFCILFLFSGFSYTAIAQDTSITYLKKEVMVPMRDGVKLFTRIYIPAHMDKPLPILMMRSPYSDWNIGTKNPMNDPYVKNMAAGGYILVYQNIRGKQESQGHFVMQRPLIVNQYPDSVDETTDTYDTIDWLLKHIQDNNGKVGILGISYPGWLALVATARPHPALKAASEQACMSDLFLGDDFHHNGAFRYSYAFEYSFEEEASKGDTSFPFHQYDLYDWYLNVGSLANVNKKYFHGTIPSWNNFAEHSSYDSFWQHQSPLRYMNYPTIPMLNVGGYWDQEDMMGPQLMYSHLEKKDTFNRNYIVLGPWYHGQWASSDADHIGAYQIGSNTAAYFQALQKAWFDYWLKGIGNGHFAEATAFQTGSNVWKTYSSWPPKNAVHEKLYTEADGKAGFKRPVSANAFDNYISDPANPVPYRSRPIEKTYSPGSRWRTWLVQDQRFVDHRPDVLSWESDTLTKDFTITGDIIAHLFASTTGTDADWIVKLIDVYPDYDHADPPMSGYELMIAGEVFRGRFRTSFSNPQPIPPNKVEEYTIDLHDANHVFKKGHRIMIQVQSTWFPIIDRNPQTFVPNIFEAKASDFKKATQKIYRSAQYATYIDLPVMEE
jgi:uncharacterized protein